MTNFDELVVSTVINFIRSDVFPLLWKKKKKKKFVVYHELDTKGEKKR